MLKVEDLIIGYTYTRTNANGERLSPATPKEGTLFYHKTLIDSGVVYARYYTDEEEEGSLDEIQNNLERESYIDPLESTEPVKVRVHSAPGESKCESCEG